MSTPFGTCRSSSRSSSETGLPVPPFTSSILTIRDVHRLKDAEWVEKRQDALKKSLRGATGTANLKDKALKEELVRRRIQALWLISRD